MSFNCLQVNEDLSAISSDVLLLQRHQVSGGVPWNRNGFGIHDPGRSRDGASLSDGHFDLQYPVNLDLRVPELAGILTVGEAVSRLKRTLPYMFRHQPEAGRTPLVVDFGDGPPAVDDVLNLLVWRLGPRWQASALPGHVILYEDRQYPAALRTYYSTQSR